MAKTFYTERDIEDLARRGVMTLVVNGDVVLTELAREKAERLGVKLAREQVTPPAALPPAPVRPDLSSASPSVSENPKPAKAPAGKADLQARVRAAVVARLGSEVDPALLDTIIRRVLDSV